MKPGDKIKFEVESPYPGSIIPRSTYTGTLRGFTTKKIKVAFHPSHVLEPEEEFKWVDITKLEVI